MLLEYYFCKRLIWITLILLTEIYDQPRYIHSGLIQFNGIQLKVT